MLLTSATNIGAVTLNNRVVFLATHLGYAEDGRVTNQLVDFYSERAKNDPGLIIVGGCYTEHLGMSSPTMISISKDEDIKGLKHLVDTIHEHNVPVGAQLYHAGRYAHSRILGEKAVSASEVYCRLTKETPRMLTIDEIKTTVKNFGHAAERAKKAGFDAVEILGSAGYIINQFLASCTNQRLDEYGGSFESRARFSLEIAEEVVRKFKDHGPVIYRISGEDFVEGGLTLQKNMILVQWLQERGIDCFDVTGGWHETKVPQITMDVPRGHYSYLADAIADVVDVPVIACNRINSPSIAEHILSHSKVQLVGMSRGFIADPQIVKKIIEEKSKTIRPCIGCNQGCLDRVFLRKPVTCAINPIVGCESSRTIGSKGTGHVAIVGAGPSGLVISRLLAKRGFDVTLFEETSHPGGKLRLAARVPGRGEFGAYITYLQNELKRLSVDMRFGTRATRSLLLDSGYDAIICATGTLASLPSIDGIESPHVTTAYEVLRFDTEDLGKTAIIGGSALGCYVALFLSKRCPSVHLFEREESLGTDLGKTTIWVILKALRENDVDVRTNTMVTDVTRDYIMFEDDTMSSLFSVDSVVVATSPVVNDRLFLKMKSDHENVFLAASPSSVMNLQETVHSAFDFASRFSI